MKPQQTPALLPTSTDKLAHSGSTHTTHQSRKTLTSRQDNHPRVAPQAAARSIARRPQTPLGEFTNASLFAAEHERARRRGTRLGVVARPEAMG